MALLKLIDTYLQSCVTPAAAAGLLQAFSKELAVTHRSRPVAPRRGPVSHLLTGLCQNCSADSSQLASQIDSQAARLHWRQNPNYEVDPALVHFRQNYGYVEFIGPQGPLLSAKIRCGILLLAPHTLYPSHQHEAEEFYVMLSGHALWQRGAQKDWTNHPADRLIHHAAWLPHATKTTTTAMLALYGWLGRVTTEATIVSERSHYVP